MSTLLDAWKCIFRQGRGGLKNKGRLGGIRYGGDAKPSDGTCKRVVFSSELGLPDYNISNVPDWDV